MQLHLLGMPATRILETARFAIGVTGGFPRACPVKPRRFENAGGGHPKKVQLHETISLEPETSTRLPALLFVRGRRDGASRRMESLVAWVKVTQKKRLRVIYIDADRNPALARELNVSEIPTLVLIKDRQVVGRLEGRATGRQIDALIRPHLAA